MSAMRDLAPGSSIDVHRPSAVRVPLAALRRAAATRGFFRVLAEWVPLRLRRGLALEEYLAMQLYDNAYYGAAARSDFVGIKGARRILIRANSRLDLYGLVGNKIACDFLLAAHGLPIMPTVALFCAVTGMPAPFLLRGESALRSFLADPTRYPLFGKPLIGTQSLGSASFDRYDAERQTLIAFGDSEIALDAFVADVAMHYPRGYLLQRRLSPHRAVRALCGDRLATVRVLTAATAAGPQVLRAAWKIPAGANAADNFWRVGNLLAELDTESGRVRRAVRASPEGLVEVTHHPDTGAALVGVVVPRWARILDLAREGAAVLKDLPLLGWDIAPVDVELVEGGAIVVEVNHVPDFRLHQVADRRGILDAVLRQFLRERKAEARAWRRRPAAP